MKNHCILHRQFSYDAANVGVVEMGIANEVVITLKFLNFGMPEILAVIYLKFKQRGQT